MGEEKVAPPTPRRRQEYRRRGMVAVSTELTAVAGLAAGGLALYWGGSGILRGLKQLLTVNLSRPPAGGSPDALWGLLGGEAVGGLVLAAPVVLAAGGAGIGIGLLQTGGALSLHPLKPDLDRLNPLTGLRRLISFGGLIELFRSLLKAAVLSLVVYFTLVPWLHRLAFWSAGDLMGGLGELFALVTDLFFRGVIAFGVLAAADYGYRLWRHERELKMTRTELKEEMRQAEGDPTIRIQLRRRHRQLAFRNMMAAVPKADVVVTNPTHLAVALRYDPRRGDGAPRVIAKGRGLVAERIRTLARQAGVPVVSNPPLAQALYRAVEVGMEIPPALYEAVAELLAYIYRLRHTGVSHGG